MTWQSVLCLYELKGQCRALTRLYFYQAMLTQLCTLLNSVELQSLAAVGDKCPAPARDVSFSQCQYCLMSHEHYVKDCDTFL